MENNNEPMILSGDKHLDERGMVAYNNDFVMNGIKRFYIIENENEHLNRAWHGHKEEKLWFQAITGSFLILVVAPDDWESPSFTLKPKEFVLTEESSDLLFIPGGFVAGIKALTPVSKLLVFSSNTLEDSLKDSYRFDSERWYYDTYM